jgi:RNA polymerase sigma factor (sigma-70 family)
LACCASARSCGIAPWPLAYAVWSICPATSRPPSPNASAKPTAIAPSASGAPKTPADELEESERRSRLELKLERLRPAHRAVLVLRDLEGLPYEEIADVTETPLGSVKGRLHRARSELIEILRTNTYDWELPDER